VRFGLPLPACSAVRLLPCGRVACFGLAGYPRLWETWLWSVAKAILHLLEFVDRKGLPVELKRLQASIKDGIGIGVMPPSEQAAAELADYFAARSDCFKTPLALTSGSAFTQEVWRILQSIPAGETRSYSDIARQIGRPSAVRAVARANGANQIALMIPCHRVIGADGSLTGYGGGLWRKQRLIEIERELKRVKQ